MNNEFLKELFGETPYGKAIITILQQTQPFTQTQISKKAQTSTTPVKHAIQKLLETKMITEHGTFGNNVTYQVSTTHPAVQKLSK